MGVNEAITAAANNAGYDLVIRNVKIANVYTKELLTGQIAVKDGLIAHVSYSDAPLDARETYDGGGMVAAPGFIETHMHIESSMMTPENLCRTILPRGSTTIACDPHELGNVSGIEGIEYLIDGSSNLPMSVFFLAPSSVPSAEGVETAGAAFGRAEIDALLAMPQVIGLAEVMDYPGVVSGKRRMAEILEAARSCGALIEGHAPTLSGNLLSAYLVGGARSDHEITSADEAREKLRAGMVVELREGSIAKNVSALAPAVIDFGFPPNATLCTDDREADDLLREGHLDHVARRAVQEGIPPMEALRMMTLNAANWLRLYDRGAISPGLRADIALLSDFDHFLVDAVFCGGRLVAKEGALTVNLPKTDIPYERQNTTHLDLLAESDFTFSGSGEIEMNGIKIDDTIATLTHLSRERILIENGFADLSSDEGLALLAVFERHGKNGNRAIVPIRDTGLSSGAVASTVAHDCHNLIVLGRSPADMAAAANALIESGGGIAAAKDGRVLAHLPLPVGGILSTEPAERISEKLEELKKTITRLGLRGSPILQISTLSLAVIPEVRLTDCGLVDVAKQEILPVVL